MTDGRSKACEDIIDRAWDEKKMIPLQDWLNNNQPDEEGMIYGKAAVNQILWVRDTLSYMVLGGFIFDESKKMLTVDGTHTSKSILLPVYRFDMPGIKIKIRGNFHDWCVRVWAELKRPFPEWMNVNRYVGYFEGMSEEKSPVSFCVRSKEELYSVIWWMLNEGIKA